MVGILFITLAVISSPQPLSLIIAILLHEAGHIFSALALGWELSRFRLNGTGLRLTYGSFHPLLPTVTVLLSGCLVGIICAVIPLFPKAFRMLSFSLSAINLLPISSLDGGGITEYILDRFLMPDKAYRITRVISVTTVICLWALSCAVQLKAGINFSLLAVSVYLTVSALSDDSPYCKNNERRSANGKQ